MHHALALSDLLDVASGRGTFLWPLLDAFPTLHVTAIDASEVRADLLTAVVAGGFPTLAARRADATDLPFVDGSFDGATLLEVMEQIPFAAVSALWNATHTRSLPPVVRTNVGREKFVDVA